MDEDPTVHLDRVREILFGAQARSFESKLEELERRVGERLDGLRSNLQDEVGRLGTDVRRELAELEERLRTERRARTESVSQVAADLQARGTSLEERVAEFEERVTRAQRDATRELEEAVRQARESARTALEETSRAQEGRTTDVDRRKVERHELALVLTDLASRLAGQPPSDGDSTNGAHPPPAADS